MNKNTIREQREKKRNKDKETATKARVFRVPGFRDPTVSQTDLRASDLCI